MNHGLSNFEIWLLCHLIGTFGESSLLLPASQIMKTGFNIDAGAAMTIELDDRHLNIIQVRCLRVVHR